MATYYTEQQLALINAKLNAVAGRQYIVVSSNSENASVGSLYVGQVNGSLKFVTDNFSIKAQEAVGSILQDSDSSDITYDPNVPSITPSLPESEVTADTYGDANNIPQITVNEYGIVTEVVDIPVASDFITSVSDTATIDLTVSAGNLTANVNNNSITYAKMQAVSATSKLLGSSSTTTPVQEITLGTGLAISSTTINNTAPDQTVVLSNGTGISITGSYPNFTITNTSPSSGGTVTDVSVVTANGVSGSVATSTTTPAITLTLGNITPTTVNKVTVTTPATGSTLTIADGKVLTSNNTMSFAGTDGITLSFPNAAGTLYFPVTLSPAADPNTTNATLTTIAGLTFALEANARYKVMGFYHIGCNNTGGVVFGITLPASTTLFVSYSGRASSAITYTTSQNTASATLTGTAHSTQNTTSGIVSVNGTITTAGTSGNAVFGFASGVAGQTSTIYTEGSFVTLTRLS